MDFCFDGPANNAQVVGKFLFVFCSQYETKPFLIVLSAISRRKPNLHKSHKNQTDFWFSRCSSRGIIFF